MVGDWTVTDGSAEVPAEILAAAAASQATLGDKLAALRSLSESFPDTVGPAAADRWVSDAAPDFDGGRPRSDEAAGSPPEFGGEDLADLSAATLLEGYRTGAFDPVEVVDACLARIDGDGADIGAVVT